MPTLVHMEKSITTKQDIATTQRPLIVDWENAKVDLTSGGQALQQASIGNKEASIFKIRNKMKHALKQKAFYCVSEFLSSVEIV